MCGICGVMADNWGYQEKKMFQNLLFLSSLRGLDSTGVFTVGHDSYPKSTSDLNVKVSKTLDPAHVVAKNTNHEIMKLVDDNKNFLAVGHARAATKGSVDIANAHPFEFENVVGVHNGTVHRLFKNSSTYQTDSEGIYALINELGVEAALNEIQGVSSAYALVYFDKREGTLNIVKNSERPLYISYFYGKKSLAFASEEEMVVFAGDRCKVVLNNGGFLKTTDRDIFTLKEHQLFKCDVRDPSKAELIPLNVKKYATVIYSKKDRKYHKSTETEDWHNYIYNGWNGNEVDKRDETLKLPKTTDTPLISRFDLDEIIDDLPMVHDGKIVSIKDKREAWNAGCVMCNQKFTLETDPTKLFWMDSTSLVCEDCQGSDVVKHYLDTSNSDVTCH